MPACTPGDIQKMTYEDKRYAQFLTYSAKLNPKELNQFRFLVITLRVPNFSQINNTQDCRSDNFESPMGKNCLFVQHFFPNYYLNWRWHSNVLVHLLYQLFFPSLVLIICPFSLSSSLQLQSIYAKFINHFSRILECVLFKNTFPHKITNILFPNILGFYYYS